MIGNEQNNSGASRRGLVSCASRVDFSKVLLAGLVWLVASAAQAGQANFVRMEQIGNQDFGLWAVGDGDQVNVRLRCASSSNYNNAFNDPPPPLVPAPAHLNYDYRVEDRAASAGYYLYLDDDPTQTGNGRIPVRFEHREVIYPTGWEQLSDAVWDTHGHPGGFKNCLSGDNSELRVTLLEADLQLARAGVYRGRFRAWIRGGTSGTKTRRRSFNVDIEIAEAVRVSSLTNVDFGTYSGTGDVSEVREFCVYSNNAGAAYNVTLSSPQQNAGAFFVENPGATASIGYTLWFKDDVTPGKGTAVGLGAISGVGDNSAHDCGGGTNAKLTVDLLETSMQVAATDDYSDTVTLLVAPE